MDSECYDDCEPIGSCDNCGGDIYADDCFQVGNYLLCDQCAFYALQEG